MKPTTKMIDTAKIHADRKSSHADRFYFKCPHCGVEHLAALDYKALSIAEHGDAICSGCIRKGRSKTGSKVSIFRRYSLEGNETYNLETKKYELDVKGV